MQRPASTRLSDADRQSVGDLLGSLATQSSRLVQDELALARQEMKEKVRSFRTAIVVLAAGGLVGLLSVMTLSAALVMWLAKYVEPWQAGLIVGGILLLVGGATLYAGVIQVRHTSMRPEQTMETLEENKEWLRDLT